MKNFDFKRLFYLFAVLCSIISIQQEAQAGGPYTSSDSAKSAMESALRSNESANACMADAHVDNDRNNDNIRKVWQKVAKLRDEWEQTLRELRSGLFCDQCWRTKSEIEKGGQGFYQHLQSVQGTAVSAPPEKIAEKEREYEQKIEQEKKEVESYRKNYQGILKQWMTCRDQNNEAIREYNEAANAARYLEWQEAQEKRRQEYEEWHRKTIEMLEEKRRLRELQIEKAKAEAEQRRKEEIDALARQIAEKKAAQDRAAEADRVKKEFLDSIRKNAVEQAERILAGTDTASNDRMAADLMDESQPKKGLLDQFFDMMNQGEKANDFIDDPIGSVEESAQQTITEKLQEKLLNPIINRTIENIMGPYDSEESRQRDINAIRELPVWEHIKNRILNPSYYQRLKADLENIKNYPDNRMKELVALLERFSRDEVNTEEE